MPEPMTPTDARAVLEKMRDGEVETLAAIDDRPESWQSVRAMYTERLAALDVALSALEMMRRAGLVRAAQPAAFAEQWMRRQVATAGDDMLDEGDCRTCGSPAGEVHEPTDPCGIIAGLLADLATLTNDLAEARALVPQEPTS